MTFILCVAHVLEIWFDLLQNSSPEIVVRIKMWARLLLCAFFVLNGAIYSHGDELHHHSGAQNSSHHAGVGSEITTVMFASHGHFEQTENGAQDNAPGVHCGSPELQPMELVFYRSVVFAETIKPISASMLAGAWLGLEPPPPRT